MTTFARAARLLPWCQLAEIEWRAGNVAAAERLMRAGLRVTR